MDDRAHKGATKRVDLRELRKQLRGHSRRLHEQLADVCEEFTLGELTREHKKKILLRELAYLLDCYKDEESWQT